MSLFKKERGVDVVDYTLLQKKGLLRRVPRPAAPSPSLSPSPPSLSSSPATLSSESVSPFSFFDSVASSAATSSFSSDTSSSGLQSGPDVGNLKIKVDDVEYKMERLLERLALIECKLNSYEQKVTRG